MRHFTRLPIRVLALLLTLLAAPSVLLAQAEQRPSPAPLADRVPAGALAYIGWAGSERVAELYEGTHAQALLRQSNFEDVINRYVPELLAKLAEQEPEAREPIAAFSEIAPTLLRRPTAIVFGGFNTNLGGAPVPKVLIFCDAGESAQAMERRLRRVFDQAGGAALKGFVSRAGNVVRFAIGYDLNELDRLAAADAGGQGSLASDEAFRKTFTELSERPVLALFVDFPGLVALGEQMVGQFGEEEQKQHVKQAIDALGVRGLGRLGVTGGFVGQMHEMRGFLGITAREGVLKLLPAGPLDEKILSAVPGDSTMVFADQIDLAALLDVARELITTFAPPEAQREIEQVLAKHNEAAGVDLERDVLRQFGPAWAGYVSPRIGSGIFSGVLVNRPRDPAGLGRSLGTAATNGLAMLNEHVREGTEGNVTVPGRTVEIGGQAFYVLNLPLIAPTWSVDDDAGLIRFGFYPQSIASARAIAGGESFADSPAWRKMRDELSGGQPVAGLRYADLPRLAPHSYPLILMGSQTLFGFGDLFGEKLGTRPPVVVLPPLATMMEHVTPSGAVSWVTEDGIRFRGVEPFPMSALLTTDVQSFMLQLMSSFGSAFAESQGEVIDEIDPGEEPNRVRSASNLRHIGQAMRQAAIDDTGKGRYPVSLEALFLGANLPVNVFISPRTNTRVPEVMAQSREAQAQWVQGNSDYVYIAWELTDAAPAAVMVGYENPALVRDGVNALFADGSVRFLTLPEYEEELAQHVEYRRKQGLKIPEFMEKR